MTELNDLVKNHPIEFCETLTGLQLNPFQREVILSKHPRVVILSPRQSGKTECLVLLSLITILQGKRVASFQPSVRQSNGLLDRVRQYLFKMGVVPVICSRSEITLDNGGAIMSKPIKSSARGDTCDLVIFDEISFIESQVDSDLMAIALPFLSKPGSRLVVSSTPRGRQGLFYKLWTEENDFQKIAGDVNQVTHYAPDFLETQKIMLGSVLFGREMLCKFDELSEINLFSAEDLEKLLGNYSGGKDTCLKSNTEKPEKESDFISESMLQPAQVPRATSRLWYL